MSSHDQYPLSNMVNQLGKPPDKDTIDRGLALLAKVEAGESKKDTPKPHLEKKAGDVPLGVAAGLLPGPQDQNTRFLTIHEEDFASTARRVDELLPEAARRHAEEERRLRGMFSSSFRTPTLRGQLGR